PTGKDIHGVLADYFAAIPNSFVKVAPFDPSLGKSAALDPQVHNGTNRLTLFVFANDETNQAVISAVYDNLGKGASGAAVQNLNVVLGVDPRESLEGEGIPPPGLPIRVEGSLGALPNQRSALGL